MLCMTKRLFAITDLMLPTTVMIISQNVEKYSFQVVLPTIKLKIPVKIG